MDRLGREQPLHGRDVHGRGDPRDRLRPGAVEVGAEVVELADLSISLALSRTFASREPSVPS